MDLQKTYSNKEIYRSEGYSLNYISDIPYLLPYGQRVADQGRGVKINEAGAIIWNALGEYHTNVSLRAFLINHYEATTESECEQITYDMYLFLNSLLTYKMIELHDGVKPEKKEYWYLPDTTYEINNSFIPDAGIYNIADTNLALVGPEGLFDKSLKSFICETAGATTPEELPKPDMVVLAFPCEEDKPKFPEEEHDDLIIIKNEELLIYVWNGYYRIFLPKSNHILEIDMPLDGQSATCYFDGTVDESTTYDFFHALRLLFLYNIQKSKVFAIHSASILYAEKLWLLTGRSGVGKSTQASLWSNELGTPIINGDLNLVAIKDGAPLVYGLPWCGTSEVYSTKTYPLGGIILLEQDDTDFIEELSIDQKALLISQRFISPTWFAEDLESSLSFAESLVAEIPVCQLHCTKSMAAVRVAKGWIDAVL